MSIENAINNITAMVSAHNTLLCAIVESSTDRQAILATFAERVSTLSDLLLDTQAPDAVLKMRHRACNDLYRTLTGVELPPPSQ